MPAGDVGLRGDPDAEPVALTFPVLRALAGPGLAVSDAEALAAMAMAFRHLRIVLEPGGVVALAAAPFRADRLAPGPVVCVASAGNVSAERFAEASVGGEAEAAEADAGRRGGS